MKDGATRGTTLLYSVNAASTRGKGRSPAAYAAALQSDLRQA